MCPCSHAYAHSSQAHMLHSVSKWWSWGKGSMVGTQTVSILLPESAVPAVKGGKPVVRIRSNPSCSETNLSLPPPWLRRLSPPPAPPCLRPRHGIFEGTVRWPTPPLGERAVPHRVLLVVLKLCWSFARGFSKGREDSSGFSFLFRLRQP